VPNFEVKFFNAVSGWLHTHLKDVLADTEESAKAAAIKAFNDVHAYSPAYTDPNDGSYHAEKGTPGYDASQYRVAVVQTGDAPPDYVSAQHLANNPVVSVGGVAQPNVPVAPPEPMFVPNPNYRPAPGPVTVTAPSSDEFPAA
jgi:hypothetical protein